MTRRLALAWLATWVVAACTAEPEPKPPAAPLALPAPPAFDATAFLEGRRTAPDLNALPTANPYGTPWRVEPLFPAIEFGEVVWAGEAPGRDDVLFVLEHDGRLWEVWNTEAGGDRRLVLDLSSRVFHLHEAGAEGVAFHPAFAEPDAEGFGELFLFYVTRGEDALLDRLSRFRWEGDAVHPDSEEILIEQRHRWQIDGEWGEHFGGSLLFGPDGYLYVAVGDEGGKARGDNPQRIDRNLFSGLLRVDVDEDPDRSHPPPRPPKDGRTRGYGIPNDNPFVGVEGALEEFWAIGLRNPWGFSFDRETGEMWLGDVGHIAVEEIDLGIAGGNYQWSYKEGDADGPLPRPAPLLGIEQRPIYSYPHSSGDSSIIGGAVYRGPHDDLRGHYVFGDHGSGRIRTLLRSEEAALPVVEEIASVPRNHLLAITQRKDGRLLVLGRHPVGVSRLVAGDLSDRPLPPKRLSWTGLFSDLTPLTPAPGVVPYEVNAPAYADGAEARRWIALPGDDRDRTSSGARQKRIIFRREGSWTFPPGTVFVQHLERRGSPAETRLLVLPKEGSIYGVVYRWDERGRNPIRVDEEARSCTECHTAAAGYVLGVNARQLSRSVQLDEAHGQTNQLRAWERAGMLTDTPARAARIPAKQLRARPLRAIEAKDASLERRARSYLDVNCAFCHQGSASSFAVDVDTPTSELVGRSPRNSFGIDGARLIVPGDPERSLIWRRIATDDPGLAMPPVGRDTIDERGAELIAEWIRSLPEEPPSAK